MACQRLLNVIDGSRNPELFFVTELYEYLVRDAFVTLPEAYPHVVRQRTSDLFRDSAEWERFSEIAASYAQLLKEEHDAANALDKRTLSMIQMRKCTAEARALREAPPRIRERRDSTGCCMKRYLSA